MGDLLRAVGEEKLKRTTCPRHPQYRGLRKPRKGLETCNQCTAIFEYNRTVGIRELRQKKNLTDEQLRARHELYLQYQKKYNTGRKQKESKEFNEKEEIA